MEMDLKNIIEKIKTEGVGEAEKEAQEMTDKAKEEAKNIIDAAEKQKEEIIAKAKQDAEKFQKNSEEALKQASRDVLLSLRQNIVALFDKVMKKEIGEQLSSEVLKEMIVKLVDLADQKEGYEVEVLLNDTDKKNLEKIFVGALKKEMQKGVTLKVSSGVEHGFRIGEKSGSSYYDFTDDAIAEAFKLYLNQKMAEVLFPAAH